jgi:hypothetical protein
LKFGLCLSEDGSRILVFDMDKFKAAPNDPEAWDTDVVAYTEDIDAGCLTPMLASFHLYQTVYRLSIDIDEMQKYLGTALLGQRPNLHVLLKTLDKMREVCALSKRITTEGAESVSAQMQAKEETQQ